MDKKVLSALKSDGWAVLTDKEKVELLLKIEQDIAKSEKRAARSVIVEDKSPGILGYYEPTKDQLVVNKHILPRAGLSICTVIHEGRHAHQIDVVSGKTTDKKNLVAWTKNWNGYLNPNDTGTSLADYYMQPIERDAWSFSLKKLKDIAGKVKDINILNDLTDISLTVKAQEIKAKRLYGSKYMQIIQAKIDAIYNNNSNNPNSYQNVMKTLGKQGINSNKVFVDYIVPLGSGEVKSQASEKLAQLGNVRPATKLSKQQKDLASKYGFSEQATQNIIEGIKKNKSQVGTKQSPVKKTKESITVNVSVHDEKSKG